MPIAIIQLKHLFVIWKAISQVFKGTVYKGIFLVTTTLMFFLFVLIPVWVVEGNSFAFQLSLFTLQDFVILAALSLLNSLFVTMQIYAMRMTRAAVAGVATSAGGGVGALFAGIAGTAFCASCLAPLFAFFGIGFSGVVFTLQYRFYFVALIVAFMITAVYLTSKKILRLCENCT